MLSGPDLGATEPTMISRSSQRQTQSRETVAGDRTGQLLDPVGTHHHLALAVGRVRNRPVPKVLETVGSPDALVWSVGPGEDPSCHQDTQIIGGRLAVNPAIKPVKKAFQLPDRFQPTHSDERGSPPVSPAASRYLLCLVHRSYPATALRQNWVARATVAQSPGRRAGGWATAQQSPNHTDQRGGGPQTGPPPSAGSNLRKRLSRLRPWLGRTGRRRDGRRGRWRPAGCRGCPVRRSDRSP
jgi:hypothetical protein